MKKLFLSLAAVVALSSCCKEANTVEDSMMVTVNTSINNSRTTLAELGTTFVDKDNMGLFETTTKVTTAIKWSYDGTSWTPETPMYWKNKTDNHNFYAYSPYVAATNYEAVAMPDLSAQKGDAVSLTAADFLYATPVLDKVYATNGKVDLVFNHASALLVLNVKSTAAAADGTFTNFTLAQTSITTTTDATFNLGTPAATLGTLANTITVTPAAGAKLATDATTYYAVINDQTAKDITFTILFTKGEVTYTAIGKLGLATGTESFVAGSKYTYTITVDLNSIQIGTASITPWTAGSVAGDGNVDAQ